MYEHNRNSNRDIEDLLLKKSSIDNLVNSELKKFNKIDKFNIPEKIDDDLIPIDTTFPGSFTISLNSTGMKAMLDLRDSVNCECAVTMSAIETEVRNMGMFLYNRVSWKKVIDFYNSVFVSHEDVPAILIAEGLDAVPYIPEHIVIKDELEPSFKPQKTKDDKVDYHLIKAFIYVIEGEYLGDIVPEQKGVNGRTLTGEILPYQSLSKTIYTIGPNIEIRDNKLYSTIDGTFKNGDGILKVESCLKINRNIDYHTGNIEYDGDVEIGGTVRGGFNVSSNGDILVNECIEPSDITAANNIYVREGLFGSEETAVTCGGSFFASHIENAYVKTKGTINIKNCIVNSIVLSREKILMPPKGTIIGSFLCGQNGAILGNVGNSNTTAEIYLGKDYEAELKLRRVRNTIDELIGQMEKLQGILSLTKSREDREMIRAHFITLKEKVDGLYKVSRILLEEIDKNDKAVLEIHGTVYPGTKIDICNVTLKITKKMSNIRFYLNKSRGEIVSEYLV